MFTISRGATAALCAATMALSLGVRPVAAQTPPTFSRASLAKTAAFTVTQTTAPRGAAKVSQVMRVEVKGDKARLEINNPQAGSVIYLANERGVFLYMPANKLAQKQSFGGNVDEFLRRAFGQANQQLKTAKKTGTATVSGQRTDVYKDARTGALLYIGKSAGFRLPVKTTVTNAGGTQTFLVSGIRTNIALSDARFAIPAGVRIIESSGGAASPQGGGNF